jgi:hypothetical protein
MALRDLINSAAKSNNLDPDLLARIVRIESGNNPYARTGSYHGLLQLNQPEFKRYNPTGDIYDPAANLNAGAAKLAGEIATFRQNYGREPTPTDIYMTHQQGQGGYAAHSANPNGAAWMNMASTAEGRQKGENWAKAAIWGNIPDDIKAQFPGGVNTVTSQDFVNTWRQKVEGASHLSLDVQEDQFRERKNAALRKFFFAFKIINRLVGVGHNVNDSGASAAPEGASCQQRVLSGVGHQQNWDRSFHGHLQIILIRL